MKTNEWIKYARDKAGLTQEALGEKINRTKGNVSAWERGAHEPSYEQMLMISELTGVSMPSTDGFKESLSDHNVSAGPAIQGHVPLISWVQAGDWCEVIDNFAPGDAEEWLACPRKHGPNTFALRVRGVSMEPKYRDGAVIYVDPSKAPDHLSNVVVRMNDEKEATFKQLVIEGNKKYLRPLNPDWPGPKLIEVNGSATICGVVIGQFIED